MVVTRYKTIALVWGLGLVLIGFGLVVDSLLGVDQSNPDVMTEGDWTTFVGFATFILSVILRLLKSFFEKEPETETRSTFNLAGQREFSREPVRTFLDDVANQFWIIISGVLALVFTFVPTLLQVNEIFFYLGLSFWAMCGGLTLWAIIRTFEAD